MINVTVNFTVAADDRPSAVACLQQEAPQMRALPGNRAVQVLVAPDDAGAVTLLHQWDDMASFDAYRAGPLFAKVGGVLRPMMTGKPRTDVYDAELLN